MKSRMQRTRCSAGLVCLLLAVILLVSVLIPPERTEAAGPSLVVTEIDYEEETITVRSGAGDKYLYFSDSKQKTWECAYGTFSNGLYVMDISWISKTKDYVLTLKGDKSTTVLSVTLPKQSSDLKAAFDYGTEKLTITGENGIIYWRKSTSTVWTRMNSLTEMEAIVKRFYAKGITLYFRTGSVNGTSATVTGRRPSKETKLTIKKQASAPKTVIDMSKLTIKKNKAWEYKVALSAAAANSVKWTTDEEKALSIPTVAKAAYYSGTNNSVQGKDVYLVFRVPAAKSKLPSIQREIVVKAQEKAPDNVVFGFASATNFTITVPESKDSQGKVVYAAASEENPYEYVVVAPNASGTTVATIPAAAEWEEITSEKPVSIKQKDAPVGSVIYVRKKAHTVGDTIYLESLMKSYTMKEYPAASTISLNGAATDAAYLKDNTIMLVKSEGKAPQGLTFLVTSSRLLTATDVESVKCGGKSLEYTTTVKENQIFVTITSTEEFEKEVSGRNKAYPVEVALKNGELLKEMVTLTVFGRAELAEEKALEVVHMGNNDARYEFNIIPTRMLARDGAGNHLQTSVTAVWLEGKNVFSSEADTENGQQTVTLNTALLQEFFNSEDIKLEEEYAVKIVLSDGQEITSGVTVEFVEAAEASGESHHFVKTIGSDMTEHIELEMTYSDKSLYVADATWNGIDIMGNAASGSKLILLLDYNKINKLTEASLPAGKDSVTYPVVITLNNGAVITREYTLTLTR